MADASDPVAAQAEAEAAAKAAADQAAADAADKAAADKAAADKAAADKAAADKAAAKAAKTAAPTLIIWGEPGHEKLRCGDAIKVPADIAENLRAAGRARIASAAEIKALGDDAPVYDSF
jgi:pimeloyl-ACP methyl ester carboxylesterase